MVTRYFIGLEEIGKAKINTGKDNFCDITVFNLWKIAFSTAIVCGQKKKLKFTKKYGLSNELYEKATAELGSILNIGMSSISAKLSQETKTSIVLTKENMTEDETEFEAPKCGKFSLDLYQMVTRLHVENHIFSGMLTKQEKIKKYYYDIPEDRWDCAVDRQSKIPECGSDCEPDSTATDNGIARLEFERSGLSLPCRISKNEIYLRGTEDEGGLQNSVKGTDLPLQLRQLLGLTHKDVGKVSNYKIVPQGKIQQPPPKIIGIPNIHKKRLRSFEVWWSTIPADLKHDHGFPLKIKHVPPNIWQRAINDIGEFKSLAELKFHAGETPEYKPIFDILNSAFYEIQFYHRDINLPSKSEVSRWFTAGY